jgi:hypothetical protein
MPHLYGLPNWNNEKLNINRRKGCANEEFLEHWRMDKVHKLSDSECYTPQTGSL